MPHPWRRYEELRPDALADVMREAPVAYWPLGLIEHHGWHLPIGFDGIKADRLCARAAARTGGVVLPVMWWGGGGGHGDFAWTHYQPPEAAAAIVGTTLRQLARFGFRVLVVLYGHYPWEGILGGTVEAFRREHPGVPLLVGNELSIAGDAGGVADHAAKGETSQGLALMPELVDLTALRPGRAPRDAWPAAVDPATLPAGPMWDATHPLFAQWNGDAREATGEYGEALVERIVGQLVGRVEACLFSGRPL